MSSQCKQCVKTGLKGDLKGSYHHTLGYRAAAGDKRALSSTRQQI